MIFALALDLDCTTSDHGTAGRCQRCPGENLLQCRRSSESSEPKNTLRPGSAHTTYRPRSVERAAMSCSALPASGELSSVSVDMSWLSRAVQVRSCFAPSIHARSRRSPPHQSPRAGHCDDRRVAVWAGCRQRPARHLPRRRPALPASANPTTRQVNCRLRHLAGPATRGSLCRQRRVPVVLMLQGAAVQGHLFALAASALRCLRRSPPEEDEP